MARNASDKFVQEVYNKFQSDLNRVMNIKGKYESIEKLPGLDEYLYDGARVYRRIAEMITDSLSVTDSYTQKSHALWLNDMLQEEFDIFGEDIVLQAMAQTPDEVVYLADQVIMDSDSDRALTSLYNLQRLIRGTMPTTKEAKEIGLLEADTIQSEDVFDFSQYYKSGEFHKTDRPEWIQLPKGLLHYTPCWAEAERNMPECKPDEK